MNKFLSSMLVFVLSAACFAKPSCLTVGDCMEIDGEIIDLRSTPVRMYQDSFGCDSLKENCLIHRSSYEMPVLSEREFRKIVGSTGTEYFIPIDIRKEDLKLLAGALSLGVVVFANDRAIMDFVQENKVRELDKVVDSMNFLGGSAGMASIIAGSYFIGAVMKNGELKQVGLFGLGAALATQVVTEVFKVSFGRMRPNNSDNPYDFFEEDKSFFSGHTSAAFSIATVIAEVYKDKPLVPYLAYGVAALTAYSRVYDKKHWASDVLAGAVVGHLVTKIFLRTFMKDDGTLPSGLTIVPDISYDHFGNPAYLVHVSWTPGKKRNKELKCSEYGLQGRDLIRACFEEALNN